MKAADIQKMTPEEKLQAIEALWDSLIHDETEIKSPDWHAEILRETELRFESGRETAEEWTQAKKALRRRFE